MASSDTDGAAWADPETPALCLVSLGVDRWGSECLNWLPATWRDEVRDEFQVVLAPRNFDRIGAALALMTTPDEFYRTAAGFNDIVLGLAAEWFNADVWHPPTAAECAWGVLEAYLLDPPGPDDRFTPEVNRYVELLCRQDGFSTLPPVFRSFGIKPDPGLPPASDYSDDPVLAEAAGTGSADADASLREFLGDRLTDLASRLAALPFKRFNPLPIVHQLYARSAELGPRPESSA